MARKNSVLVHLTDIHVSFDANEVLAGLDMKIYSNEILAIVGSTGAGKTQILRAIAKLSTPTRGQIKFIDPTLKVAYVFQKANLLPWLSVIENLRVVCPRLERSHPLISRLGLLRFLDMYPYQLSGGTEQKINLLRALLSDADLILLDEPFTGLDFATRSYFHDELLQIQSEIKKSMILVTHDINEALSLGDRVYLLSNFEHKLVEEFERIDKTFFVSARSAIKATIDETYNLIARSLRSDFEKS